MRREEVVFSSTGGNFAREPHRTQEADRIRTTRDPQDPLRSSFARIVQSTSAALFSAFFPSDCRICQRPLTNASRLPVCDACLSGLAPIIAPRCAICGDVLVTGYRTQLEEARCNECGREMPLFARATAYGAYDGGLREMVHLLKYQRVLPAADVLGRMLSDAIATLESELPNEVLVIPVPLHSTKFKQRGFNQSELIAESAMREFKRHSKTRYTLAPKLLVRKRPTESQVGLTREQRQANVRGAFSVRNKEEIAEKHVLLVDDVFTTGTTVSECARVLLKAGAETVWVATVARALRATTTSVEGPAITGTQEREEGALARHASAL